MQTSSLLLVLQCRLHCDPGFVSHRTPVVTCSDGRYTPAKPSSFVCQPAAALVFSQSGEVEVVSEKCSMTLGQVPDFAGQGRTASLLDNQIVLIGNNTLSGSEGNFISIQNPRDGLLAINYSKETFPSRGSPFRHSALTSDNKLTLLGGKYKSRAKLDQNTWTDIKLKWVESQKEFTPNFFSACTLQQGRDSFYVFGGAEILNKATVVRNTILHINTTSLLVREIGTMSRPRMAFGCEFLNKSAILLAGGHSDAANPVQSIQPDEIINLTDSFPSLESKPLSSRPISTLLPSTDSLWRLQHSLIRINETIFALGGLTTEWRPNSYTSTAKETTTTTTTATMISFKTAVIKAFNEATLSWEESGKNLKSEDSGEIVIVPFPASSLDCVPDCKCGVSRGGKRIFGGVNAEVGHSDSLLNFSFCSEGRVSLDGCNITRRGKNCRRERMWWHNCEFICLLKEN